MENVNCEADLDWSGKQLVPVPGFGWLPACVQEEVWDRFKVGGKVKYRKMAEVKFITKKISLKRGMRPLLHFCLTIYLNNHQLYCYHGGFYNYKD